MGRLLEVCCLEHQLLEKVSAESLFVGRDIDLEVLIHLYGIVLSKKQGLLLTLFEQEKEMRSHRPSLCYTNTLENRPMGSLQSA